MPPGPAAAPTSTVPSDEAPSTITRRQSATPASPPGSDASRSGSIRSLLKASTPTVRLTELSHSDAETSAGL